MAIQYFFLFSVLFFRTWLFNILEHIRPWRDPKFHTGLYQFETRLSKLQRASLAVCNWQFVLWMTKLWLSSGLPTYWYCVTRTSGKWHHSFKILLRCHFRLGNDITCFGDKKGQGLLISENSKHSLWSQFRNGYVFLEMKMCDDESPWNDGIAVVLNLYKLRF